MTHTPQACLIPAQILRPCAEEDRPGEVLIRLPGGDTVFMRRTDVITQQDAALAAQLRAGEGSAQ